MSSRDPIFAQVGIYFERILRLLLLSGILWAGTWVWFAWQVLQIHTFGGIWNFTLLAFDGTSRLVPALFWAIGVGATALTSCVFLLLLLWWKNRGDTHHRGAQIVDRR